MATTDRVSIELYVDDQGSVQIRNVKKELEGLQSSGTTAAAGIDTLGASLSNLTGGIVTIASITAGVYSLVSAFKAGITAIDQFQMTTIGIAAGLTSLAKEGQGTFEEMFSRNLGFSKEMYEALRVEDAKRFASLDDLMVGYNALVQKGYAVRLEEVDALGVLVDKIKLATAGQNTSIQINQEIRALMEGQVRAGSLLAMELRDRLGPGWEEIVNKHREAGTLLRYLADLWPGIGAAAEVIEKTLEAQRTTLEGNLKYVGREGLAGAYDDIVGIVQSINNYLREHGDQVASNIARAWEAVRDIIIAVKGFIIDIYNITSKVITITVQVTTSIIGPAAKWLTGAAGGGGLGDLMMGMGGTSFEEVNKARELAPPEEPKYIGLGTPVGGQTIPRPRPADVGGGGRGGKGDGGLQASLDQMQKIINSLQKDLSRLTEGSLAEIDAWEKSQMDAIDKVARKGADAADAKVLVEKVKQAKIYKINEDFDKWYAGQIKDQYGALEIEEKDRLKKAIGNEKQIEMVKEVYAKKNKELELNKSSEMLSIWSDTLNKLAGIKMDLSSQISLQRTLLDIEDQRNANTLQLLVLNEKITQKQADQLRQIQRITTREKKREVGEKGEGFAGGIQSWARERVRSGETYGYESGRKVLDTGEKMIIDNLKDIGHTLTKSLFGKGEPFDPAKFAEQLGELIVNTLLDTLIETLVQQVFTLVAQFLTVTTVQTTAAMTLTTAGVGLSASAIALTAAATALTTAAMTETATSFIPGFHEGGVLTAHRGLGSDERLVLAQTGEWILNRRAASQLSGQGISFAALNSGKLPVGGSTVINHTYAPTINRAASQADYNKDAKKMWMAHDRERKRRGLNG